MALLRIAQAKAASVEVASTTLPRSRRQMKMSGWWDKDARQLHQAGLNSDDAKAEIYSLEEVARAAVYTRQDLVLVVSYISSVNKQLAQIRKALGILAALAFVAVVKYLVG